MVISVLIWKIARPGEGHPVGRLLKEKYLTSKLKELRKLTAEEEASPKIGNWFGEGFLERMEAKQYG